MNDIDDELNVILRQERRQKIAAVNEELNSGFDRQSVTSAPSIKHVDGKSGFEAREKREFQIPANERRIPMFSIQEKVLTCMFQSTLRSCQRLRKRNVCLLQSRPHKKAKNQSSTWRRAKHRWREKVPKVPLEIFSNLNFRMLLMNSPTLLSQTHWLLKQRKDQMRRRNSVFCRMRVSTKDDVFCKHILLTKA